ncbi:hypothetical protein V493_04792 [Pseudogymnoascus sp. VKM F-4281 (FW-2241)]|nr:hypothetical protein V493_04792 [Pseudogymnoascus sp. VKM F-4281 (FW-2241)]
MTSTPAFKRFIRTVSNSVATDEMPTQDERTSLLNGNHDTSSGENAWSSVFARSSTPGDQSENPLVRYPATWFTVTKITLMSNYVNILLVFVPLGIVAGATGWDPVTVFALNFFAIVPLAAVLSFATEEIAMKLGQTMGGLMNATFGNAVELIVCIVALRNGEIRIVQSSMLGSILSNVLLVLGCCFVAGGIHNTRTGTVQGIEQTFNSTAAGTMSSLLILASASLIIPATLYTVLAGSSANTESTMLMLSRGTAIILLILYVLYLVFQLRTHTGLFNAEHEAGIEAADHSPEEAQMSPWAATIVLILTTVAVAFCAEYLVDSIDALVEKVHVSKTFVGLILIPIVGNAAEHVTAIVVALKDKMDLAMGVAIGSSIQIALLVTPFLVVMGWIIGQPMTLHFETFETVVFFLSVLVVSYVCADGKSNYLEGAMLLGLYFIIALAFLVYPDDASNVPEGIKLAVRSMLRLD